MRGTPTTNPGISAPRPKKAAAGKTLPCGRPLPKKTAPAPDAKLLLKNMSQRLADFVDEKTLNRSEAREKILETIIYEARHFKAQDLLNRLKKRYPEVGKATLYRTLPLLVKSEIIQEGPTDSDGQTLYELAEHEHHDHIVCLNCNKIFEFHDPVIEKQQEKVSEKLEFAPVNHRHIIYGTCEYFKNTRAEDG